MHELTIDKLLSLGNFTGVGNSWWCEIAGCKEDMSDIVWFSADVKYCLCKEHCKEYLSRFNYEAAKRLGYV